MNRVLTRDSGAADSKGTPRVNRSRIAVCLFADLVSLTQTVERLVAAGTDVAEMAALLNGTDLDASGIPGVPDALCRVVPDESAWREVHGLLAGALALWLKQQAGPAVPVWLADQVRQGRFALLLHDPAPESSGTSRIILTAPLLRLEFHDLSTEGR